MSDENIETPSMAKVLKDAIENRLVDVHTSLPGTVISYDSTKQMANVQPSIQRKYSNGKLVSLPIINNVPVHHIRGGKASILMPVKAGDPCMIFFAERSLDIWKSKGGQVDPQDTRKHNLSDAFILVGVASFSDAIPGDATKIIIKNDQAQISIDPTGKFKFTNGTDELVDLLSQALDLCSQIANAGGPTFNASEFTALKTKVDGLKG